MRGAPTPIKNPDMDMRIIPAYAGSTKAELEAKYQSADHPRVCGEHLSAGERQKVVSGSSPRMRGAQFEFPEECDIKRIIPAYAGST